MSPALRTARVAAIREAMEEVGYDALVIAGRGVISQYGYLEYVTGYCPVVRAAYAVLGRGGAVAFVAPTAADAWYARTLAALDDVRVAGQGDVFSEYQAQRGRGEGDFSSGQRVGVRQDNLLGFANAEHGRLLCAWRLPRGANERPVRYDPVS